eukprot:3159770-Rhodomonas_salina.1
MWFLVIDFAVSKGMSCPTSLATTAVVPLPLGLSLLQLCASESAPGPCPSALNTSRSPGDPPATGLGDCPIHLWPPGRLPEFKFRLERGYEKQSRDSGLGRHGHETQTQWPRDIVHTECTTALLGQPVVRHGTIKHKPPQSPYNLYQECGCVYLIVRRRTRCTRCPGQVHTVFSRPPRATAPCGGAPRATPAVFVAA